MSRRLVLILCACLTLAAYAPTWRAGFVYEDLRVVMGTPIVQQQAPWNWRDLRSLSILSFRLNHALDGNNPRGYHAVNVCVHLVNGMLVFLLAESLIGGWGAVAAAGLFWLAPIQTESVAYLAGRTELLAAFCVLLATVLALRLSLGRSCVLVPLVLLAGLLTKETAAVGFLLVPLVAWVQLPDLRTTVWRHGTLALEVLIGVAVVGAIAAWLLRPVLHLDQGALGNERSLLGYWSIQSWAIGRYVVEAFIPIGLTIDHDFELMPHALAYLAFADLIALAIWTWHVRISKPLIACSLAWVLLALLPRMLVRIPEYANEHQMYLPFVGLWFLAGMGVNRWVPWREEAAAFRAWWSQELSG